MYEGKNFKKNKIYDVSQIVKLIRAELKQELPECTFSVTKRDAYALSICLMKSPQTPFQKLKVEDYETNVIVKDVYGSAENYVEYMNKRIEGGNIEVRYRNVREANNLSEYGKNVMQKAAFIAMSYNFDRSDIMTDYFDTNFYIEMEIGKWNKPFQIKA